jgi:2-polyprenyl-3-methyl-5-hydroxy-6-metoxy-1,4-benzoquinol methylase
MEDYKKIIYQEYYSKRSEKKLPSSTEDLKAKRPFYENIIRKHFPKRKEVDIIDIGCGYGAFVSLMKEFGYHSASGVDVSSEMINVSKKLKIQDIYQADIMEFLRNCKDESFDVVTAIDVIEHFSKQELFELLFQISRVIKKDGLFITHQPNAEGVFGNSILYGDYTHELSFTRKSIDQILQPNGFFKINSFEDKPLRYNHKGIIRRFLWDVLVRPIYLFLVAVEDGNVDRKNIFSKNFITVAHKK